MKEVSISNFLADWIENEFLSNLTEYTDFIATSNLEGSDIFRAKEFDITV